MNKEYKKTPTMPEEYRGKSGEVWITPSFEIRYNIGGRCVRTTIKKKLTSHWVVIDVDSGEEVICRPFTDKGE